MNIDFNQFISLLADREVFAKYLRNGRSEKGWSQLRLAEELMKGASAGPEWTKQLLNHALGEGEPVTKLRVRIATLEAGKAHINPVFALDAINAFGDQLDFLSPREAAASDGTSNEPQIDVALSLVKLSATVEMHDGKCLITVEPVK